MWRYQYGQLPPARIFHEVALTKTTNVVVAGLFLLYNQTALRERSCFASYSCWFVVWKKLIRIVFTACRLTSTQKSRL
jgi:hypothetical protein